MKKIALLFAAVLLALSAVPAFAGADGKPPHGCAQNGQGSGGPYDSTCDGSPSGNGNGGGKGTGKPCAGCVGSADNKNPHGQHPNGSDHNAGYECDRNHGVGKGNPAHSGCAATPTTTTVITPTTTTLPGSTTTTTVTPTTTTIVPTTTTTPKKDRRGGLTPNDAKTGGRRGAELPFTGLKDQLPFLAIGLGLILAGLGTVKLTR